MGSRLGNTGGGWLSDVFGMGDYKVEQNTLVSGTGVPTFGGSEHTVRIRHREFLGDITGSIGFVNNSYVINAGSSHTFPWLSGVAENFQMYQFHGLIFEFVSSSATALNSVNTALGTVLLGTNYNARANEFANKAEMLQYENSVMCKPCDNVLHPIECKPALSNLERRFVRTGVLSNAEDYLMYDMGLFQIATVGMQAAATIGNLYVTYDVELLKPRIDSGGTWPGQFTHISNGPYVAANDVLGSIQTAPLGDLGVTVVNTGGAWDTIQFPSAIMAGRFLVTINWIGDAAANISFPTLTYTNCTLQSVWALGNGIVVAAPSAGTNNSKVASYQIVVTIDGYDVNGAQIYIDGTGTLPATPAFLDVFVLSLPLSNEGF
jgi:hypothetical protein